MNSILAQTQRLYEGQLVGPESLTADSTGDQTVELISLILKFLRMGQWWYMYILGLFNRLSLHLKENVRYFLVKQKV